MKSIIAIVLLACGSASFAAYAGPAPRGGGVQLAGVPASPGQAPAASAAAPDSIILYFGSGSAAIRPDDAAKLDHAARLFRDAQPIIMEIAGGTDAVGNADTNLRLSQKRADAVFRGLVARGIPASRFQILAKGVTDPAVHTDPGVAEPENRRVQITWR